MVTDSVREFLREMDSGGFSAMAPDHQLLLIEPVPTKYKDEEETNNDNK